MLANLPVARSAGARTLFLASAGITAAILLWAHHLALAGDLDGLAPIFFVLFTYFDYPAAAGALLTLVVALFVPGRVSFRPLLRWVGEHPIMLATVAGILLCIGTLAVYQNHPLSMDEYAVLFQSRVFAAGHLAGQLPAPLLNWLIPEGFQNYFLTVSPSTGYVASQYWPSFSLLLAPFTWLGIPWACNPAITAFTLVVIHRLALRLFDNREAAGLALLFTAASPVIFADGISYYSMPAHLLANCLYVLLLLEPTERKAFAAGVVGSVALTLHNPVPHILFALPWLVWVARRKNGLRLFSWLAVGYLPLSLLLGVGWFWFYNHLAHQGASAAASPASSELAHVASAFGLPTATVMLARLIGIAKIWLWSVPGLLLLAGAGAWKWRLDPKLRLLWISALLTLVGYLFVPADQGHGWGFRYFHSAWLALPLLAAGSLTSRCARTTGDGAAAPLEDGHLHTFVVACTLLTLVAGVGLRTKQIHEFIADQLSQLPNYEGRERHVVFVDAGRLFYGYDLVQNDPWLRGNVIRMASHGVAQDEKMMQQYFPTLHEVYVDRYGTVWSTAAPPVTLRRGPQAGSVAR